MRSRKQERRRISAIAATLYHSFCEAAPAGCRCRWTSGKGML